jgi:hypothetical protein
MTPADFPATAWRKSSYSANSTNCVEVAFAPAVIGVRDTKQRGGGTLVFSCATWAHFRARVARR